MDPARRAYANYGDAQSSTKTPRQIEYQAFARVTKDLRLAAQRSDEDFPRLVEALSQNQRLWAILSSDVIGAKNELPDLLRSRIFYLAKFTRIHTRKVLERTDTVDVLLEVNMSVMRGLSKEQDQAPCPV
ncbi:MAG: flagellar biosynthesis regulator FlaF [Pseudomonadota bacterium]